MGVGSPDLITSPGGSYTDLVELDTQDCATAIHILPQFNPEPYMLGLPYGFFFLFFVFFGGGGEREGISM